MKKQPEANQEKQLFKNLTDIGLQVGNKTWEPQHFFKAWKSIIQKARDGRPVDIAADGINWLTSDGGETQYPVYSKKALTPFSMEYFFKIAFTMFIHEFGKMPDDTKTQFVKEELDMLERHARVARPVSTNGPWDITENNIYNMYTDWLLDLPRANKQGKKSKNILLPELLKHPTDIKVIDSWLETEGFLESWDDDKTKPYKWIGIDQNEELGINSLISVDEDEDEDNQKTRSFSLPYQIAAFGYWLHDVQKLFSDNCAGEKLCRAVAGYYNMEISQTMSKAFRPSNRKNLERYYAYYKELGSKINSIRRTSPTA